MFKYITVKQPPLFIFLVFSKKSHCCCCSRTHQTSIITLLSTQLIRYTHSHNNENFFFFFSPLLLSFLPKSHACLLVSGAATCFYTDIIIASNIFLLFFNCIMIFFNSTDFLMSSHALSNISISHSLFRPLSYQHKTRFLLQLI